MYLRGMISSIDQEKMDSPTILPGGRIADGNEASILRQLLDNACDKKGSLMPLRLWFIKRLSSNADREQFDVRSSLFDERLLKVLLRDFGVVYSSEGYEEILRLISSSTTNETSSLNIQELLKQLIQLRGSWTNYLPDVRDHVVHLLMMQGKQFSHIDPVDTHQTDIFIRKENVW